MPDWCQKTIAIDLDGTLTHEVWSSDHYIGAPAPNSQRVVNRLAQAGWQLIIHTCRKEGNLVRDWADAHFPGCFAAVNVNPSEMLRSRTLLTKPFADLYIDDKAWPNHGTPVDWFAVEEDLEKSGYFTDRPAPKGNVWRSVRFLDRCSVRSELKSSCLPSAEKTFLQGDLSTLKDARYYLRHPEELFNQ